MEEENAPDILAARFCCASFCCLADRQVRRGTGTGKVFEVRNKRTLMSANERVSEREELQLCVCVCVLCGQLAGLRMQVKFVQNLLTAASPSRLASLYRFTDLLTMSSRARLVVMIIAIQLLRRRANNFPSSGFLSPPHRSGSCNARDGNRKEKVAQSYVSDEFCCATINFFFSLSLSPPLFLIPHGHLLCCTQK